MKCPQFERLSKRLEFDLGMFRDCVFLSHGIKVSIPNGFCTIFGADTNTTDAMNLLCIWIDEMSVHVLAVDWILGKKDKVLTGLGVQRC